MNQAQQQQGVGMTSIRTRRRLIDRLKEQGIVDDRVLNAIESVPRHQFVQLSLERFAYDDVSLPIGNSQTITQPYVVALMSQLVMELPQVDRVLEVGTGCGYQAAVLSLLIPEVYSVERIQHLSYQARQRMRRLKYDNVTLKYGDGIAGWREQAPFDAIVIAAASHTLPRELEAQLAPNGRMVFPRGSEDHQDLVVRDHINGRWREQHIEKVSFVPLLPGTESSFADAL